MNVVEKPWGREELIEVNDRYTVKRLTMRAGHRCSLQYHRMKRETIYVLSGKLRIERGELGGTLDPIDFLPGDSVTIPAGEVHRMIADEDAVYLEASTSELEDVVRIADDYSRPVV